MINVTDDNDTKRANITDIGTTANTYGGVVVTHDDGRFFWSVDFVEEFNWEEIGEPLYLALLAHEEKRRNDGGPFMKRNNEGRLTI